MTPPLNRGYYGDDPADVRTELFKELFSIESLKSCIMVAGGDGGSDWIYIIGGNVVGLDGGKSNSAKSSVPPKKFP